MKLNDMKKYSNLSAVDFLIFLSAVLIAVIVLMVAGYIDADYTADIRQFAFSVGVVAVCYCVGCLLYDWRR